MALMMRLGEYIELVEIPFVEYGQTQIRGILKFGKTHGKP